METDLANAAEVSGGLLLRLMAAAVRIRTQ